MTSSHGAGPRLVATFVLGCVLLNYPILSIFSRARSLDGLPSLYAYVFVAWLLLIVLMALAVERRE